MKADCINSTCKQENTQIAFNFLIIVCKLSRLLLLQVIVDLMLKSPEIIQNQLSESISYIGREDFPFNWTNLLPQMVEKFATGDFNVINGVLRTAHSLFRRYRHEFRSDNLWMEIKMVLEQFAQPLTKLLDVSFLALSCT